MYRKYKITTFFKIPTLILIILTRIDYNDVSYSYRSICRKQKIFKAKDLINIRLLENDVDEVESKTTGSEEIIFAYNLNNKLRSNNQTTLSKNELKKSYKKKDEKIKPRYKKGRSSPPLWKRIDKHFEKKVFKNFTYIYDLKEDKNVNKKMFAKILFKKYRLFLIMPFVTKLFGLIVFIIRATKVLEEYTTIAPILLTLNILISHVFGIFSITSLIYILVKKIKFDLIMQNEMKSRCKC
ncbi:Plasmodium exported protein, unknown function [Plasmodium vivax]|uniref:(malaria parasite P. vivax) hypothetical protein n=1 Tax=Plasmodium vivax TaxID=5855 RepID=A0A1G4HA28_PLAVI|nr:unnamed protein product [Plasmodium vivax]CAI7719345.1 Plasmodium exported protein, unknown function [Plasmodium vivax]SCO71761.1 Plasmodium exported protein, unknown function [Plasmodium vivax]VUZ94571.1 Plasmodium exported protein, unknown function [Plasmodium vivax]